MPWPCRWSAAVWQVGVLEDGAECVEGGWVVDGGGWGFVVAVGDAAHRFAEDFAGAGFGEGGDDVDLAQCGDGADLVADQVDEFGVQGVGVVGAGFEETNLRGDGL